MDYPILTSAPNGVLPGKITVAELAEWFMEYDAAANSAHADQQNCGERGEGKPAARPTERGILQQHPFIPPRDAHAPKLAQRAEQASFQGRSAHD